jgi:hypothetical protein
MWLLFWMCVALSLPVAVARYWAMSRRQRHIDRLRGHDPELASEIEQAAYGRSPATRPLPERFFDKPRRHNHF